jgi:Cu-processing system permease protein
MNVPRISTLTAIRLIGRGVMIETIRRKEFYVLIILMMIFVLGAVVASFIGIKQESVATFLLNLGVTLAGVCAHVLTGLTAARQIPTEIESRTLYPLLAKPVERAEYLLGKWIATGVCGCIVWITLFALAWLAVPRPPGTYSFPLLLQMLSLQCVSLFLLSALALWLSLLVPQGVNIVLLTLIVGFGGKAANFISARFSGDPASGAVEWLLRYIPSFGDLNTITRYTDGIGAMGAGEFLGLVFAGSIFAAAALLAAAHTLERRPL